MEVMENLDRVETVKALENLKKLFLMIEYFTLHESRAHEIAGDGLRYIAELQQGKTSDEAVLGLVLKKDS